jgi:cytochrome d ubiquinol oxidase subunit I
MRLARRWSKVAAVTFATGAVTGTVLSFEFGLLWPGFMERYGDAFGIAFAIEGIFFFTEAIFLAIYIYGWKRLGGWPHFWTGVPMLVAGIGGAFSVVTANAWMNTPQGFTLDEAGKVVDTDVFEVLFSPAWTHEVPHMILAAYMVAGFLFASVYAVGMLRGRRDRHHRLGLLIPLTIACAVTPVQIFVGDVAAREVAEDQPAKFAAFECIQETGPDQTEYIGGICTDDGVKGGIGIPGLNSLLVDFSTDTVVTGLNDIPPDERPPANTLLHLSFDLMVGIGFGLLTLAGWLAVVWWRRRDIPRTPWFLRAVAISGAAAVVAVWCGWIVTEVGRQPWMVQQYLRVSESVTEAEGLWFVFAGVIILYTALGTTAILVLRSMARRWREEGERGEEESPYGPSAPIAAGGGKP